MSKEDDNKNPLNMKTVAKVAGALASLALTDGGKKFLCGTYSDGSPRSLSDALKDEIVSPEERDRRSQKAKKSKKKKKNKNSIKKFNSGFHL